MYTLFYNLIQYAQNNTMDFVQICFLILTSILAVKTYLNAKKTLFSPIRSEMVKYQTKVITDFIDNYTSKGYNLDSSSDYWNLIKINIDTDYLVDIYKDEYSFENHNFDNNDIEILNYCKKNIAGLFEITKEKNVLNISSTMVGNYDITMQYLKTKLIKDKELNNKDLSLQRFYFTNKFYSLYSDLGNLETNPFVPTKIKSEIIITKSNILRNIQNLYSILSVYTSNEKTTTYHEILLEFNQNKIDSEKDMERLRTTISKYFKVDGV